MKRLYRSKKDRMLGGVCAGLGEHLDVDPTVIRLIWAVVTAPLFRDGYYCLYPGMDHHSGRRHRMVQFDLQRIIRKIYLTISSFIKDISFKAGRLP